MTSLRQRALFARQPEESIRSELFSAERLEQLARDLAQDHGRQALSPRPVRSILPRIKVNGRRLVAAYQAIAGSVRRERPVTPAAEWLVDNFYVVTAQLREIRQDLPPGYYRRLPKLSQGPLRGIPRVYSLVWEYIAHTDSAFLPETFRRFIQSYQESQHLQMGELWSLATFQRVVLVENLRRLAEGVVNLLAERQAADRLADSLLGLSGGPPGPRMEALKRYEGQRLPPAFAVQLFQRLREQDPAVGPAVRWLEQRLEAQGVSAEALVQRQHLEMAAGNATVRNIISSMRLISEFDWADFFESVNPAEQALRKSSNFGDLNFTTRDRYRHAIEELARRSTWEESAVAGQVLGMCAQAAADREAGAPPARAQDPGHHLISAGRKEFEEKIGFHVPWRSRMVRAYRAAALPAYLLSLACFTAVFLGIPLRLSLEQGMPWTLAALLAGLALVPASDAGIALVNRMVVRLLGPRPLPRLEMKEGISVSHRTLVVVPVLLTSALEVEEAVERLEVHFLSNCDGDVTFALLSDWTDAEEESLPADEALLQAAIQGIQRLNRDHGEGPAGPRFRLLHRRRKWNPSEGKWMGWERKRGKLRELNRVLRGGASGAFIPAGGLERVPDKVRYVVTLDADTRMPIGLVRALVGTLAHPLNQPQAGTRSGRVTEGYGILQPRVTYTLPAGGPRSLFQMIFAGPAGTDPYSSAASDVYQDLFAEGSYTGKGIYDVDAFEKALADRVPENALLSHDLFEGIFARAGLATDLEFFEEFPAHYVAAVERQKRWVRGDWQMLGWLFRGGMPALGRWKIADNLRRSMVAPFSLAVLAACWLLPGGRPLLWGGFILVCLGFPSFLTLVTTEWVPRRPGVSKRNHLLRLGGDAATAVGQLIFSAALLAQQAWWMVECVSRTVYRLALSRRHLLEWIPASAVTQGLPSTLAGYLRRMPQGLLLAAALGVAVATLDSRWAALPWLVLWLGAPAAAARLSSAPRPARSERLSAEDQRTLRTAARRTWHFFETFAGPRENNLPPDNFQEDPRPVVAHRTSPTNIGLYLLACLGARDFGWMGRLDCLRRLEETLETLDKLEHYRGHFLNWYDSVTLQPLLPRYVSTVDSGNLAGHLVILAQACQEWDALPLFEPASLEGLEDTLQLARQAAETYQLREVSQILAPGSLARSLEAVAVLIHDLPSAPLALAPRLADLELAAENLVDIARTLTQEQDLDQGALLSWAESLKRDVSSHTRDFEVLCSWTGLLADGRLPEWLEQEKTRMPLLERMPRLVDAAREAAEAAENLKLIRRRVPGEDPGRWEQLEQLDRLIPALLSSATAAGRLQERLKQVSRKAQSAFDAMEFGFLYDPARKLFSIGFKVGDQALDSGCYDLLASEARLASYLAVARGEVAPTHWFRLGRPLVPVGHGAALLSWSGSMFEYLMPALVMQAPEGSLLEETCRLAVQRQVEYGASLGLPWGFSESACFVRDAEMTYQYSSFGVPTLGLKRGLASEKVVSPYSSGLAAMVAPAQAAANLRRLEALGACGQYGFFDALDFTPGRIPEGRPFGLVRNYMAHHQGMMLAALTNVLCGGTVKRRFHRHPLMASADLLLQERVPRNVPVTRPVAEDSGPRFVSSDFPAALERRMTSPHDSFPQAHLLSNGNYSVMLTSAGSGFSRWNGQAVTRWREDATRDHWGSFFYLQEPASGRLWSAGFHPAGREADWYQSTFVEDRAQIQRRDGPFTTTLDVLVSPEDDAEIRRVELAYSGPGTVEVEVTSYAEVVLAPQAADEAHPAFSNLFVQTEFSSETSALLASRRPRASEPPLWAAHLCALEGEAVGGLQYETDRARFLGRGHPLHKPAALDGRLLSNSAGPVLDPVFSLRRRVRLTPGRAAALTFVTLVAPSREKALALADKYRNPAVFERVRALAWTQAQVQLRHMALSHEEADLFQSLAGRLLYSNPGLRPASEVLKRSGEGVQGLWQHGISGDFPIVLLRIDETADREMFRQLLKAHGYLRMKGLVTDLVVFNEEPPTYAGDFQAVLESMLRMSQFHYQRENERPGGVTILPAHVLSPGYRDLVRSLARVVLASRQGSLADQVVRTQPVPSPWVVPARRKTEEPAGGPPTLRQDTQFFNGLGGFSRDGREYLIHLSEGQWTPCPWVNVIANQDFGSMVSEAGSAFTWNENSQENRLTPWFNDPVSDPSGEALYLRDEESGALWSPTALPIRLAKAEYQCRHGQGYSRFDHLSHGISASLTQFVPLQDSLKVGHLILRNRSGRTRVLSVTAYVEWVLGQHRARSSPYIFTASDLRSGAIFAQNVLSSEFKGRVAFLDLRGGEQTGWTGDRTEFLGRNGSLERPAGLQPGVVLSGRVGAGMDPCGVLQNRVTLPPGGEVRLKVLLGQAASEDEARKLLSRWQEADPEAGLSAVREYWDQCLGTLKVSTPDKSLDLLVNRWLLYQALSCRIWARSALYQSGGAYGFRDQLQDSMALCLAKPEVARAQLLKAAERQFPQGDVLHWWHPPSGRGVRTRFSDDRLWLPYAVCRYVAVTGDTPVLDRELPFLDGPVLAPGQDDYYFQPGVLEEKASLYQHCVRAIEASLSLGSHGLPLMGSGDWNDGMNRVGHEGKGESVWLAWFLADVLQKFSTLAAGRGDQGRARDYARRATELAAAVESQGWDGDWYRRAYFDDGTPLGSAAEFECRIDSLAQSWAVLSGRADPARARRAMAAVEEFLIHRTNSLVLLFTPPFGSGPLNPGYIKSYPPGIRENGSQYNHAASWVAAAFALQGEGDKAMDVFNMLNPVRHSLSRAGAHRYKGEPYAVAADIYSEHPHTGRAGWTWYTGAAGWMYRVATEFILGIRVERAQCWLDPCVPRDWPGFSVELQYGNSRYQIAVSNQRHVSKGVILLEMDGVVLPAREPLQLAKDGKVHTVRVEMG